MEFEFWRVKMPITMISTENISIAVTGGYYYSLHSWKVSRVRRVRRVVVIAPYIYNRDSRISDHYLSKGGMGTKHYIKGYSTETIQM